MKKLAALILGGIIAGTAATSVAAAEYEVQKGDSLWNIAKEHRITVEQIIELNELESTVIYPDQRLVLYETYEVEEGDTLFLIAKEFDVTVDELKEWNDLTTETLQPNQKLIILDKDHVDTIINTQNQPSSNEGAKKSKKSSAQNEAKVKSEEVQASSDKAEGKTLTVSATAYTAKCAGCSGITATGVDLNKNPNAKVIAVDPNVIPLGSKVYVEGYGEAIAADTGGAIKGNKIDIHVPTKDEAYNWGIRNVKVTIMD